MMTYRCQMQNTNVIPFDSREHYIILHGLCQISQPIEIINNTEQNQSRWRRNLAFLSTLNFAERGFEMEGLKSIAVGDCFSFEYLK